MQPHHIDTIERVKAHFESDPQVRAVILGGSLAHGFGKPDSDVDIQIIIGEHDYARRLETGDLTFFSRELAIRVRCGDLRQLLRGEGGIPNQPNFLHQNI